MSVFNVGIFRGPRYSSFDWSHGNRISMGAGKINVIASEYLNIGDKIDFDVSNVVRQAPMLAPVMDTYRVDVHAFAVRLRTVGHVARNPYIYEDFFNLQKNVAGNYRLPSLPLALLFAVNGFRNGTLFEQLGFPTFKKDRDDYLSFLRSKCPWVFDPVFGTAQINGTGGYFIVPVTLPRTDGSVLNSAFVASLLAYDFGGSKYYRTVSIGSGNFLVLPYRGTLIDFILSKYPDLLRPVSVSFSSGSFATLVTQTNFLGNLDSITTTNVLDLVYQRYNVDSIGLLKEFEDWLLDGFLSLYLNGTPNSSDAAAPFLQFYGYDRSSVFAKLRSILYSSFPDLPSVVTSVSTTDRLVPSYPFLAYWKVISDWYINTVIDDPDDFFLSKVIDDSFSSYSTDSNLVRSRLSVTNTLAYRFWSNDYFTSAFPSAQLGSAVGIPVNGTIIDLRNANAMQKLRERLLHAGSRIRDVWFSIWGKKTSAAILDMSEVIGSWSNEVNIDNVSQTSMGQNGSPQANFSGVGLGYRSGGSNAVYHAEEPTFILVVASISPRASYFQGLPRKLMRAGLYDYAIPQLANVGEQRIYRSELYLGSDSPDDASVDAQTFGYTRRNGDFMWTPDEVHGDFRGSLDYWHNARVFGSSPSLSREFLQIRPSDDNLNRIFAVDSDAYDHFYCHFRFTGYVVRSLPKHVVYDL